MKKLLLALSVLAATCSCITVNVGNGKHVVCKGPVTEQSLQLEGFHNIVVNGASDLEVFQGESCAVTVKANEEVFEYLDFHVAEDSTLVLETIDHVQIMAKEFKVSVTLPYLSNITVNGSADAKFRNYKADTSLNMLVNGAGDFDISGIEVPTLSFQVNGAGDLDANGINVDTLTIVVNGAGDVNVSGKTRYAILSVTGAGDIDARNLEMEDYEFHKSGFASIRLKKD